MARPLTGQIIEKENSRGTAVGIRIWSKGRRYYVTLGYVEDGWTPVRVDQARRRLVAEVQEGAWPPPDPEQPHERVRTLAHAYAELRRCLQSLDRCEPSLNSLARQEVRRAFPALHSAEDALARAMKRA